MTVLELLREKTKAIHDSLDHISGVDLILRRTVNNRQYEQILINNYRCYKVVEKELNILGYNFSFAEKILVDLKTESVDCNEKISYSLSAHESLGAAYVISGSQLGATMIGQSVKKSPGLKDLPEQKFYSRPTKIEMQKWKSIVKELKDESLTDLQSNQILTGALKTFELFKSTFEQNPIPR